MKRSMSKTAECMVIFDKSKKIKVDEVDNEEYFKLHQVQDTKQYTEGRQMVFLWPFSVETVFTKPLPCIGGQGQCWQNVRCPEFGTHRVTVSLPLN